jgi:phosphohistidine phosphatase
MAVKRGPGRPPGRKPGRPRKTAVAPAATPAKRATKEKPDKKRKPGRPKKTEQLEKSAPKKTKAPADIEIFILRHGIAEEAADVPQKPDRERVLTAKGKKRMKRNALGMAAAGWRFDRAFTSPLIRARQTADIVAAIVDVDGEVTTTEALVPDAAPELILEELRQQAQGARRILLVGHEPHLSTLVTRWLGLPGGGWLELKKGGVCKLVVSSLKSLSGARLDSLLPPRQLRKLG